MLKNLLKILIILGIVVGVFYGISISSKKIEITARHT